MTRGALIGLALWACAAGIAVAQPPAAADAATAEARREALLDPAVRRERMRALHLSLDRLQLEQSEIDMGGPLAATIAGAVVFAGGLGVAILTPLLANAAAAAGSAFGCLFTFGLSCESPETPTWVPIVSGVAAGVSLFGLVSLVLGASASTSARRARRPLRDAARRDREELRWLESIDATVGDQAGVLTVRGRF